MERWAGEGAGAPRVPICPDGSCGSLLGSQARWGECRDPTWFVVVSFLGCRRDLPHRDGHGLQPE